MRKVLTLDIETSPHLCYSFQTWNTNIMPIQVVEPTRMICVAAKWEHERKIRFFSEYEGFEWEGMSTEYAHLDMVQQLHALMDEADVIVTYNGDKFDIPHINREFDLAGMTRPSPYVSVDLYKVIKSDELWMSHKLAYIAERKGLSTKMDNSGWRLWIGVLSQDPEVRHKAWLEMRRYNKQDVRVTEDVYHDEMPNIKNLPNPALFDEEIDPESVKCQCGSTNVQRRGFAVTKTRRYPRFHCQECGKWFKGNRSEGSVGTQ